MSPSHPNNGAEDQNRGEEKDSKNVEGKIRFQQLSHLPLCIVKLGAQRKQYPGNRKYRNNKNTRALTSLWHIVFPICCDVRCKFPHHREPAEVIQHAGGQVDRPINRLSEGAEPYDCRCRNKEQVEGKYRHHSIESSNCQRCKT